MINGLNPYQAVAFTDGAYSQNKNKGGYGIVLFTQDNKETYDKVFRWKTQSHQQIIKLHNVGAECEAVKFVVKKKLSKRIFKKSLYFMIMKEYLNGLQGNGMQTKNILKIM